MITERLRGLGDWSLTLSPDTPRSVLDRIGLETYGFGHVVILPTQVQSADYSDVAMLSLARYSGVYRRQPSEFELGGPGVGFWLGDEEGKGDVFETARNPLKTAWTLTQWVSDLRPVALSAGTVTDVGGTFAESFLLVNARESLDVVCDFLGAEWRVNPNFTLDAGPASALFRTTPNMVVVRTRGESGRDLAVTGVEGSIGAARDLEDYSHKVIMVRRSDDPGTTPDSIDATATVTPPYKDPLGNAVRLDRKVDSSNVTAGNASGLATAQLGRFSSVRREISLSASKYDIGSDLEVGDYVWVFDPLNGFTDTANEVYYRGRTIHPLSVRVLGYSWPVAPGMGVYFRSHDGTNPSWLDLTPFVEFESGNTRIEVGSKPRPSA